MIPYSRFYKCVHFDIRELVDPVTYELMGENAWSLFDPLLLSTMDRIRERYKVPVKINDWHTGGQFKDRGFRSSESTTGSKLSAHRRGQAMDFDITGLTAEFVRKDILANQEHIDFMFVTRIELGVTWVHIDTVNVPTRIQTFSAGK